jgi:hypothetical protein
MRGLVAITDFFRPPRVPAGRDKDSCPESPQSLAEVFLDSLLLLV